MSNHTWRFFRIGGFDQVSIETAADLMSLEGLDQKLWAALSCPVKDLAFDAKTLELIDSDHDGHIRAPEIIEAIKWAASLLKDPELLVRGAHGLPLSEIDDKTEEGRRVLASARNILDNLGKTGADTITVEDTESEERIFEQMKFNGDGIVTADSGNAVTADSGNGDSAASVITDIIECLGAETDRSGAPGVSQAKVDQFFEELHSYAEWQAQADGDDAIRALGDRTQAAFEALCAVRNKVNDYFARCSLAQFDARSAASLNPGDADYLKIAPQDLSDAAVFASFPIAAVQPGMVLPLSEGINPAWSDEIARLREDVVAPILGEKRSISADEWNRLCARFAPYGAWLAAKPQTALEPLGIDRIREIDSNGARPMIEGLIARDREFEPEASAISSVDKLVRYCRDLHTLVNNFVAFRDFYSHEAKAVFQAGTLYLDGRSCDLCVKVDDIGAHVGLASLARIYLVYCTCIRRGGTDKMNIAAAFTAGDSDQLIVGRNGVFYDRAGQDWDAAIVRIVEHPISIRQAFWMPYKQAARALSEQLMKLAAARSKASQDRMVVQAMQAGMKAAEGKAPAEKPFDAGRFAGIFAAIGLAIGAIGTAIASIVTGLLRLAWWQLPLAVIGFILIISGPSVLIAWFKLKKRNLGPILDANGWAVNSRAKINIKFGASLTSVAKLPEGTARSLADPYADKKRRWPLYVLAFVIVLATVVILSWKRGNLWVFGF